MPHLRHATDEKWLWSACRLQRYSCSKVWTDRRMTDNGGPTILISSPGAFGPGELKRVIPWKQGHQHRTVTMECRRYFWARLASFNQLGLISDPWFLQIQQWDQWSQRTRKYNTHYDEGQGDFLWPPEQLPPDLYTQDFKTLACLCAKFVPSWDEVFKASLALGAR